MIRMFHRIVRGCTRA